MRESTRQNTSPAGATLFLFCLAKTAGISRPRPMPIIRLGVARKNPFQVVNRPAMAPRTMTQ